MYKLLVFEGCGTTAIVMPEVVLSTEFFMCDAKNKVAEWDKFPAALPLVEKDLR